MPSFVDDGEHLYKSIGLDLVDDSIRIQGELSNGVFVEFCDLVTFFRCLVEGGRLLDDFFADTPGVKWRILSDVIVNMAELAFGVSRPPHHDWISFSSSSAVWLRPSAASC